MVNMLKFTQEDMVRYFEEQKLSEVYSSLFADGMTSNLYGILQFQPRSREIETAGCKDAIDRVLMSVYVMSVPTLPQKVRNPIRLDPASNGDSTKLYVGDKSSEQAWIRLNSWLRKNPQYDVPPLAIEGEFDVLKTLEEGRDPNYFNFKEWIDGNPSLDGVVSAELLRERRIPELYISIQPLGNVPEDMCVDWDDIRKRQESANQEENLEITLWGAVRTAAERLNYRFTGKKE